MALCRCRRRSCNPHGRAVANPSIGLVRALLAELRVHVFERLLIVYAYPENADPDDDQEDTDDWEGPVMVADRLPDGYRLFVQTEDEQLQALPVDQATAGAALAAWTRGEDWRAVCGWQDASAHLDRTAKPELIRIEYRPDSRTDHVGRHADGQFMVLTIADRTGPHGGPEMRLVIALLRFDHDGNFTEADARAVLYNDGTAVRAHLVAGLTDVTFGEIGVRTFSVEAGGVRWALVDESWDDMARFTLYPLRILFAAPFHGIYST
jgi:hypothetical protein